MSTELDLLKVQYIENQIIQYRNTLARYGINSLEFNTALGKLKEYIQQYGVAGRETPDEGKHKAAFDAFLNCIHKRPLDMNPIEKTLEHTLRKIEWDIHRALFRIKQQNGQESTPQAARPPARAKSVFTGLFSSNVKRSRLKDLSDQMYSVYEAQGSMPEHHAHETLSPARALLVHPKKLTPEEQRFVRQPDEAEDQYIARLCEYINKSIHQDHKEEEALEAGHTATIGAFLHFIKRHPSAMKEYISMRRSDYLIWIHNAAINERFYKLSIECHNEPHVRIISISCRLRNVPMHWGIAKQFLEAESYPVNQIPLHARNFQRNSNSIEFIQTALNDFLDVGITASEFESKNKESTERFLERLDVQEYLTQNIMYNMNCLITSNPQIIHALKRFSLQAVEFVNDSHLIIVVYRGIDPSETDQIRRRRAAGINFKHANVHAGGLKEDHYDKMKAISLLNRILDWINSNSAAFEQKYNENFRLFDKWIKNSAVINVNHHDQAIFLMGPKLMEAALSHARQSRSTRIQTNRNGIPYIKLNSDEYNRIWPSSSSPDAAHDFAASNLSSRSSIRSIREPPPRPPSDRARIEPMHTPRPAWTVDPHIPLHAAVMTEASRPLRASAEPFSYASSASAASRTEVAARDDPTRTMVGTYYDTHIDGHFVPQQHADMYEMHEFEPERRGPEPEPRRRASSLDREDRAREPRLLTSSEQQYWRLGAKSLDYFRSGGKTLPSPEYSQGNVGTMPFDRQPPANMTAADTIDIAAAAAAELESRVPRSIGIRSKAPSPESSTSNENYFHIFQAFNASNSAASSRSNSLAQTGPSRFSTHSPSLPPTQQNSLQQLQTHISTWLSESDTIINTQADEMLQQIKGLYRNVDAHVNYTVSHFIDKTYQKIEQLRLPEEILNEIIKTANTHCQLMDSVGNFIQFNPQYYRTMENFNRMQIKGALMTLQIAHHWKQFQENAAPLAWV